MLLRVFSMGRGSCVHPKMNRRMTKGGGLNRALLQKEVKSKDAVNFFGNT